MPKRDQEKKSRPDNAGQYRRFVQTAREAQADESPDAMDRAFERVVKPKKPKAAASDGAKRAGRRD